jgi:hypothetical protein
MARCGDGGYREGDMDFSLMTVEHYLILDTDRHVMIHHNRRQPGAIETSIWRDGLGPLDPPGLDAEVAAFFVTD